MGGRSAEQIIFNDLTSGAGNDIAVATDLAKKMICEWGMNNVVGPITYSKKEEEVFLGKEISKNNDTSEEKTTIIDHEVSSLVKNAEKNAINILKTNILHLHNVAKVLLEKETMNGEEMKSIIINGIVNKSEIDSSPKPQRRTNKK